MKFEGSYTVTTGMGRKWQKTIGSVTMVIAHLVIQLTYDTKFEGLNAAATGGNGIKLLAQQGAEVAISVEQST